MNDVGKVQAHHIERKAYLYVRQSSMRQVVENIESAKRQYALRARATALGWPDDRIVVIDSDQGESGASAAWRTGFQQLVSEVGMGRVGMVMGLEVSRLARNNADWHRLLEICALSETLILDEDGVYEPLAFNDRLLLGLKGAMSEAELHVLKARLRGGILNKARRGEYRCQLPTGLVYDEAGDVVLDPDAQVRDTIAHFFETFVRVGSATQTVKAFRNEGIRFPSRTWTHGDPTVVFRQLNASTAMRTLYNPRYAGTYAYGRRRFGRTADGKKNQRSRDPKDWIACIPDAHPGYISWDQYQENLALLKANGRGYATARSSPPREGSALLQGRAVCGRCGEHLRVRYAARRGGLESWYVCDRKSATEGESGCQVIAGPLIDKAVGSLIAERMTPIAVELAVEVRREIDARYDEADQLRCQAIERARVSAELAERRFMKVDPANRLVADTLEGDWNEKLRALSAAQEDRDRERERDERTIDERVKDRLVAMTTEFKLLWNDSSTPNRERKRMFDLLVEDVTLVKLQEDGTTTVHVRFKGGRTQTLSTVNPKPACEQIRTPPDVVAIVDELLDDHVCDEIAQILNRRNIHPGASAREGREGDLFNAKKVAYLVNAYGLRTRYERLRQRGLLTTKEIAKRLNIHQATVPSWVKHGIITRHAYNGHRFLYDDPGPNPPVKQCSRWNQLVDRAGKQQSGEENPSPLAEATRGVV